MLTSRTFRSLLLVFSTLVLATARSDARPPAIQDNGAFFSAQAKSEAARNIIELERSVKKDLAIETFREIPEDIKRGVNLEDKAAVNRLFNQWAVNRAKSQGVNGVYVLLVKTPPHIQIEVGNDTQRRAFTLQDRDVLLGRMRAKLHAAQNDDALLDGVGFVSSTMRTHAASLAHTGTAPVGGARGGSHGSWGWLLPLLLVAVVVWVIFGVIRGLSRRSDPGMSPLSGGGGGGFFSSMLGGLFGAAAGMWMYNQFFSDHGTSAMGAERDDLENSDRGFTGRDDDYSGSGDSYGDSSGGGDSGGGDSGGGGDF